MHRKTFCNTSIAQLKVACKITGTKLFTPCRNNALHCANCLGKKVRKIASNVIIANSRYYKGTNFFILSFNEEN